MKTKEKREREIELVKDGVLDLLFQTYSFVTSSQASSWPQENTPANSRAHASKNIRDFD